MTVASQLLALDRTSAFTKREKDTYFEGLILTYSCSEATSLGICSQGLTHD